MKAHAAAVVAVCVLVSAVAGVVLATALTALHGPSEPGLNPNMIRCWGWYEGTYAGRQGAPCPAWWPAGHP